MNTCPICQQPTVDLDGQDIRERRVGVDSPSYLAPRDQPVLTSCITCYEVAEHEHARLLGDSQLESGQTRREAVLAALS